MAVCSLLVELTRLKSRYAVALTDPYSCPRNREILRTKIAGFLQELVRVQKEEAAKATQVSDKVEIQRMERDIKSSQAPTVVSVVLSPTVVDPAKVEGGM